MHQDKDMIRDERIRDDVVRKNILLKAVSRSFDSLFAFGLIAFYLAINFLGFGGGLYASSFFGAGVGILVAFFFILVLLHPIASFFDRRFMKIKLPEPKQKKRKNIKKSNEPEEATFIGINDY